MLSALTRHFLHLTATPHNGKDEDFQLFMALPDADRFEAKFRDGVHTPNVSDMMHRMVKKADACILASDARNVRLFRPVAAKRLGSKKGQEIYDMGVYTPHDTCT